LKIHSAAACSTQYDAFCNCKGAVVIRVKQIAAQAGSTLAVEKISFLRMPELDGLRGIAIFLVLVWHYAVNILPETEPGSPAAYAERVFNVGWSGVDLFFVLSGFLIGGILIDNKQSNNYYTVFYVRRICRIFPLYFSWFLLFCILLLAARLLFLPVNLVSLVEGPLPLWSYATFSQNLLMSYHNTFGPNWMSVTWSLAVEEQFYFVLPFVIRYLEPRKLPWVLVGFIVAAPLLRVAVSFSFSNGAIAAFVLLPCRADALLLGVLCAWMMRQQQVAKLLANHRKVLYAAFAILLLGVAVLAIKYNPYLSIGWRNIGYTWFALFYSCFLLIAVTEKRGIIKTIAMSPPLRRLGIIAYGVFIFHIGILELSHWLILHHHYSEVHNVQELMVTIFALVVTLVLANLSWTFFEKPLVAMGHGLNYQRV
jgi:peptidoglycan/LPS O-acetylase OafA/YrhL